MPQTTNVRGRNLSEDLCVVGKIELKSNLRSRERVSEHSPKYTALKSLVNIVKEFTVIKWKEFLGQSSGYQVLNGFWTDDSLVSHCETFYEHRLTDLQKQCKVVPHCCMQKHESNSILSGNESIYGKFSTALYII